tara:strand:- start:1674 stop:2897 length:1224 start_codon:yes stop_codon:yes gene_type:complete
MKIKIIILTLFTILYSYDSYISFYGSGEKLSKLNPSNISLGWSKLFDSNTNHYIGSLSSLFKSNKVRLSMASDFNFNSINDNLYFNQKINYFSALFPIKNDKTTLGFSLSPLYRINTNIIENEFSFIEGNEDNPPYAYKTEYDFEGGPSIASMMISTKGYEDNNYEAFIGIQINYIFGSLYSNVKHSVYDIVYDENGSFLTTNEINDYYTAISSYSGLGFEMQFSISNYKHQLITSFNVFDEIDINFSYYDDTIPEQLELGINPDEENTYKFSSPFEINLGYAYKIKQNRKIIMEYYNYSPYESNSDFNLFNNSDLNKDRISLGFYTTLLDNKLSMSTGLYFIKTYNDELKSNRNGLTFGVGVYTIPNFSIDLCLELGQNEIEYNEPLSEKYFNLYLGITAADTWFK